MVSMPRVSTVQLTGRPDEEDVEQADGDGEDGDGMEHKVLPLGFEPGDEQVHQQHAEHTDEGDALETQIEEARRQREMDDPPPTFFKEGVIEDHQPEPEGQVVDFQRIDGRHWCPRRRIWQRR